jgi:hypothetical protein
VAIVDSSPHYCHHHHWRLVVVYVSYVNEILSAHPQSNHLYHPYSSYYH